MGAIRWGTRGRAPHLVSDSGDIICYVPHIFSLGFVMYWFHTNLFPHILQQNCAHEYSNNTIMLCIWAWERCRTSAWMWLQKRMKKKSRARKWYSVFHWQKPRNNARLPDTAKLRLKAMLSVLDPTFVFFTRFRANGDCLLKLCMLVK